MIKVRPIRLSAIIGAIFILTAAGPRTQAAAPGNLEQLLGSVPAIPPAQTVIWYGSQAALKQSLSIKMDNTDDLAKLSQAQRIAYLKAFGTLLYYSPFLGVENNPEWLNTFGFNSFQVDRELTIGTPPDWFNILEGRFDPGAISGALSKLGFSSGESGRFSLGEDNALSTDPTIAQLVQTRYNRLAVSADRIVASPSTGLLDATLSAAAGKAQSLAADAAYLTAVRSLETSDTPLLTAVLFSGAYLQQNLLSGPGSLPAYNVAAIGVQRDNKGAQSWTLVLAYSDKASADAAAKALPTLVSQYKSAAQPDRVLFQGWKATLNPVSASADGKAFAVVLKLAVPSTTDVNLINLVQNRDLGFLAVRS